MKVPCLAVTIKHVVLSIPFYGQIHNTTQETLPHFSGRSGLNALQGRKSTGLIFFLFFLFFFFLGGGGWVVPVNGLYGETIPKKVSFSSEIDLIK